VGSPAYLNRAGSRSFPRTSASPSCSSSHLRTDTPEEQSERRFTETKNPRTEPTTDHDRSFEHKMIPNECDVFHCRKELQSEDSFCEEFLWIHGSLRRTRPLAAKGYTPAAEFNSEAIVQFHQDFEIGLVVELRAFEAGNAKP
jgi:hypothetical protein